jgi:hypothetical protein
MSSVGTNSNPSAAASLLQFEDFARHMRQHRPSYAENVGRDVVEGVVPKAGFELGQHLIGRSRPWQRTPFGFRLPYKGHHDRAEIQENPQLRTRASEICISASKFFLITNLAIAHIPELPAEAAVPVYDLQDRLSSRPSPNSSGWTGHFPRISESLQESGRIL